MSNLGEETKVSGVFGGVQIGNETETVPVENATPIDGVYGGVANTQENVGKSESNLPAKQGFWSKFKAFWLQEIDWNKEIKVELTPYQQKVEDEINEFLHQEITWKKVHDFLFQEITFGKKK